ncbi:guanine nucleotide exchange factor MSS4 [Lampetra planeri]
MRCRECGCGCERCWVDSWALPCPSLARLPIYSPADEDDDVLKGAIRTVACASRVRAMDAEDLSGVLTEDGKNAKAVLCPRCDSQVLRPRAATIVHKQMTLPSMKKSAVVAAAEAGVAPEPELLNQHWVVNDMYAFENVGFTHTLAGANVKYLACADCEAGPIGWHCLDDCSSYYVALGRVKHA